MNDIPALTHDQTLTLAMMVDDLRNRPKLDANLKRWLAFLSAALAKQPARVCFMERGGKNMRVIT